MAHKSKTKKKPVKNKKPPRARKPRVPLTNEITHVIKMRGKSFRGGYERRWEDATCDVDLKGDDVAFKVACQTVIISKLNLKKLGVALFQVPTIIDTLPKIDGLTWASALSLGVPVKNEGQTLKMSAANEPTNGVDFVVFSNFGSRYRFKVETDTFKELVLAVEKNYEVVELTE